LPAKLHCIKGAEEGQVLVVPDGEELVIGRSKSADITLDDKLLSRKHAKISVRENAALLTDLQSSNGTYLNGERVSRETRVVSCDQIQLGTHVFQVELSVGMVGSGTSTSPSIPVPLQARTMVFCSVCYRAVPKPLAVERPGFGDVCPDCTDADTYPEDMIEGFRLLERIREGRLGVLFRARHLTLHKDVAVKIVRAERACSELVLLRYIREAKIGGRLFHPNIVEMYDAAVSRGHYYINMEYLSGETLWRSVARRGPLPIPEIVGLGASLAEALAYAHGQSVVHRDVSSACIHLSEDGRPKIGDFGLGKLELPDEESATPTGESVGSLCFVAPEQLTDATSVDHRVDIFGLGASLYHALTGAPPFAARTVGEMLENRKGGVVLPLTSSRQDCPDALATIVTHCLAESPAHRYQTAQELADALRGLRVR